MGQPIKSDEFFAAIDRGQWRNAYVLAGPEEWLMDEATRRLRDYWLADDTSGLNLDRFDGEDHRGGAILQAAQTLPFLGRHRVIRIDHAESLSKADQTLLAEALPQLPPETRLLIRWQADWKRDVATQPLVEAVAERGQVVIFWSLFLEQAQRWAIDRARTMYGKRLSASAASWLVAQAQEGLRFVDMELAKVTSWVGDRAEIDTDDIQASFGYGRAASPFEWITAIRQKNTAVAVRILEKLLDEGEEPIRLQALLSRSLRDWLAARSANEPAATLAFRFHLRRGDEHRFSQELARWDEAELIDAVSRAVAAEHDMKTGRETPDIRLTLLTVELGRLLQPADLLR